MLWCKMRETSALERSPAAKVGASCPGSSLSVGCPPLGPRRREAVPILGAALELWKKGFLPKPTDAGDLFTRGSSLWKSYSVGLTPFAPSVGTSSWNLDASATGPCLSPITPHPAHLEAWQDVLPVVHSACLEEDSRPASADVSRVTSTTLCSKDQESHKECSLNGTGLRDSVVRSRNIC